MSSNRKRHWHFTLRESRKMFTEQRPEMDIEFIPSSTRVVLKAPEVRISIPLEVERAVLPPPKTEADLRRELREWTRIARIMRAGEAQGVFAKKDLWQAEWQVEKLRSLVGELNPDGSRVRHPGPLKRFLDTKFAELRKRVMRTENNIH